MQAHHVHQCSMCNDVFHSHQQLQLHIEQSHPPDENFVQVSSGLHDTCAVYRRVLLDEALPPLLSVQDTFKRVREGLIHLLTYLQQINLQNVKVNIVLMIHMIRSISDQPEENISVPFRAPHLLLRHFHNFIGDLDAAFRYLDYLVDCFISSGSGWNWKNCEYVQIEVGKCRSLRGGHGGVLSIIPTGSLRISEFVVSEEPNHSDFCFLFAIAHYMTGGARDKKTLISYIANNINLSGIQMPIPVTDIIKFEKRNQHLDIKIHVLYENEGAVSQAYISKRGHSQHTIVLLLHLRKPMKRKADDTITKLPCQHHYTLIENVNLYLRKRYTRRNGDGTGFQKGVACLNCLNFFRGFSALKQHETLCYAENPYKITLSSKGDFQTFDQFRRMCMIGLVGFFDFESLNVPLQQEQSVGLKTKNISLQTAFAYSLIIINVLGEIVFNRHYIGEDAVSHFLRTLLNMEAELLAKLKGYASINMSNDDNIAFEDANQCYICGEEFDTTHRNKTKVRDHCHQTGKYQGAAHNICNLQRKENKSVIPLYSHNFTGYDSHLLVTAIRSDKQLHKISCMAQNMERFKTIQLNSFVFLDSLAFLNASLDTLTCDLVSSGHAFPILSQMYPSQDDKTLLLRKGVFPYEFCTSIERLQKQQEIPDIDHFYSKLKESSISVADHEHANHVFRHFRCQNMVDYTILYVTLDVLLLAEAMSAFREKTFSAFRLDCAHYLSLPMLSFDIMLKFTKAKIEHIADMDMFQLTQKHIRGGVSFINQRLCEATSDRHLLYLDVNNLYGYAQTQPLPISEYVFLTKQEIRTFRLSQITSDCNIGYILEVDLEYPPKLHVHHSSFPLAPHHIDINWNTLSPFSKQCHTHLNNSNQYKARKLTSTFLPRKNYVCHGRNLVFYLDLGLKLTKIHSIIQFRQSTFLKPYIDYCTDMRASSNSDFQKRMWKLFVNACFGKFIENVFKRLDCNLITSISKAQKHIGDIRYQGFRICSDSLIAVFRRKVEIFIKQHYMIGFSILELSKLLMMRLYYQVLKPCFRHEFTLGFTDTDSLLLLIQGASEEETLEKIKHVMDFSNYPKNHPLFNGSKKNMVGFLKNESPADSIRRFVGIRAKCYSYETSAEKTVRKCKGVGFKAAQKIPFQAYLQVLKQVSSFHVTEHHLRSKSHQIHVQQASRQAFTTFDDKRYLMCAIHSVPYGSWLIEYCHENKIECYFCSFPNVLI